MEKKQKRGIEKGKFITKGIDSRTEKLSGVSNNKAISSVATSNLVKTKSSSCSIADADNDIMTLDGRDSEIFVSALLHPALPSGRLKKAIARYKKIMD
ncbi:MAG: hypothetical protein HQK96_15340 [Nitrospirae bacterium]|nr:hypothetical protein [Nitrospirota bacterium]